MPRPLHIACLQTRPMPTMEAALAEVLPMAEAAARAGARMLFLPEYCGGLATQGARLSPPSEPEPMHPVLAGLRAFAARRGVWVSVGSMAVDGPGGRIFNRGYMLGPGGEIAGRYDKIHLFDVDLGPGARFRESETVVPGNRAVLHETAPARVGHTICYDLRFPGLFRALGRAGAEIIACPAAFTRQTGAAHWHVLLRARAIENTCFVVAPCAVGPVPGGGESYGHSLVVSPWGEVLADGDEIAGVIHAQIDLDEVPRAAARIPSLRHERAFDLAAEPSRRLA